MGGEQPILDPAMLRGVESPELVFALVAPVGTPLEPIQRILAEALADEGYETKLWHLSRLLSFFTGLPTPPPACDAPEFDRIWANMTRGDELRKAMGGGDALALMAAGRIRSSRPPDGSRVLQSRAHVLRQLKHPHEVVSLRRIYSSCLHVIGVYCPEEVRRGLLLNRGMSNDEAQKLLDRDERESLELGQQVEKTFYRSDFFLPMSGTTPADHEAAKKSLTRYLNLVFGRPGETPTLDEYGMFLAHAAGLRSDDLSRQVGAALLSKSGELLSVGCNEVPKFGGGQYWCDDPQDQRDRARGFDANDKEKQHCIEEVARAIFPEWFGDDLVRVITERLQGTRIVSLTEFGRAVHAEMEAVSAACRKGLSVRDASAYTTLFPCHNCAKHLVCAGIRRVVYVEPYPKSKVSDLHDDSVTLVEDGKPASKVVFEPFCGVAPRVYPLLFSDIGPDGQRMEKKWKDGKVRPDPWGLRLAESPLSYIDREAIAAESVANLAQARALVVSGPHEGDGT